MSKTKEVYVTVRLIVDNSADSQEIIQELDYEFKHSAIRETEIISYEEKRI